VPLPQPYKRTPAPTEHSHTINSSLPILCRARITATLSQSPTVSALPPHRCPSLSEQSPGCATLPPPFSLLATMPPCPGVATRLSSVEFCGWPWWSVHHGLCPALVHEPWTESMLFPLKNKSHPKIQSNFAKSPLSLLEIKPLSMISITGHQNLKIIPNIAIATFQKLQIGPKILFAISLQPQL
jgi:hypothetical protein